MNPLDARLWLAASLLLAEGVILDAALVNRIEAAMQAMDTPRLRSVLADLVPGDAAVLREYQSQAEHLIDAAKGDIERALAQRRRTDRALAGVFENGNPAGALAHRPNVPDGEPQRTPPNRSDTTPN